MNQNERISKQIDEIASKTLLERIKEDKKFKEVRDSLKDEGEQKTLDAYVEQYMGTWQKELLDPLIEAAKNPETREQIRKELSKRFG